MEQVVFLASIKKFEDKNLITVDVTPQACCFFENQEFALTAKPFNKFLSLFIYTVATLARCTHYARFNFFLENS